MFITDKFSIMPSPAFISSADMRMLPCRILPEVRTVDSFTNGTDFTTRLKIYLGNIVLLYSDNLNAEGRQNGLRNGEHSLRNQLISSLHSYLGKWQLMLSFYLKDHIKQKNYLQYDSSKNLQKQKSNKKRLLLIKR